MPLRQTFFLKKKKFNIYPFFFVQDGKYAIVTDRWQTFSDVFLDAQSLELLASYADEFLVHGVDVEGKRLSFLNLPYIFFLHFFWYM
jgi:hypothetical protein